MTTYSKVTAAWNRIHADHPEIHSINKPRLIGRMQHRDFWKIVQRSCNLRQGSAVLEAGCGSGRDSLFFSYLGYNCTAVDINSSPLEKLRSARDLLCTSRYGQPLSLAIELADIFQLPYESNTFDFVFNSGVVEHFDAPTRKCLLIEMARVTKPGGFVVVVFPNKQHFLEGYWKMLIAAHTDFAKYDIPEDDLGEIFVSEISAVGLEVILFDWIDCYDTISHFPSWYPLRAIAYAATVCLPRPPSCLRKKIGTRTLVVTKKKVIGKYQEET